MKVFRSVPSFSLFSFFKWKGILMNFNKLFGKHVKVQCSDNIEVEGYLINIESSKRGRFGNIILQNNGNKRSLIRGSTVQIVKTICPFKAEIQFPKSPFQIKTNMRRIFNRENLL